MSLALQVIACGCEAAAANSTMFWPSAVSTVSPSSPGGYAGTYLNNVPLGSGGLGTLGMTCFGCNKPGHMSKECPEMRKLERQNKVKLDGMGKWVLTLAMNVPQQRSEAIAKAV
jgi:hypothetical protein